MIGIPPLTLDAPVGFSTPVDPNAGTARQWLVDELAKAEYRAAQPTWFDRLATDVWNWVNGLTIQSNGITQTPILIAVAVVVLAAVVAAYFVFGPPRLNRRSSIPRLFTVDDERTADAMHRAAEQAAARGDFTTAVEELFRCIARGLAERGILSTSPGTTARAFAAQASAEFVDEAAEMRGAADVFDRVRYLGAPGTAEDYARLVALERRLSTARAAAAVPV